jgi:hypothetical protein
LKIRRWLQGLTAMVLLSASAGALHAQDFRVFIEGGASSLRDKQYYSVYGGSFTSTYRTGNSFTVGAEYPIFKTLSAEGTYGRFRNNLAITNVFNSSTPYDVTGYGVQGQRVTLDANAHAAKPIKGVRPFLVFGLDVDRFAPTSDGAALAKSRGFNGVPGTILNPDYRFGYNFGFGMDIALTHLLAVRVDARDHRVTTPTLGLPHSATPGVAGYYPVTGGMNDFVVSAGFVIHFNL